MLKEHKYKVGDTVKVRHNCEELCNKRVCGFCPDWQHAVENELVGKVDIILSNSSYDYRVLWEDDDEYESSHIYEELIELVEDYTNLNEIYNKLDNLIKKNDEASLA